MEDFGYIFLLLQEAAGYVFLLLQLLLLQLLLWLPGTARQAAAGRENTMARKDGEAPKLRQKSP